jgi:ribosome biogenesis GTPase A
MDATAGDSQPHEEPIRWVALLRDALQQCGDERAVQALDRAHKLFQDGRVYITVAGKTKCGRSSLINALLGRRDDLLAPAGKLYSTNAISGFARGNESSATILLQDRSRSYCGFERINEFVTDEHNPRNIKGVAFVEVTSTFDTLDPDIVLVDTPGVGTTDSECDRRLLEFLPHSDAVLLLAAAKMPLNRDDAVLVKRILESKISKVFLAINKADQATHAELAEATAHNRAALQYAGVQVDAIRCISACRALLGEADEGLNGLQGDIAAFLTARKKAIVGARLVSQALAITERAAHVFNGKKIGTGDPRGAKLNDFCQALRGLLGQMRGSGV